VKLEYKEASWKIKLLPSYVCKVINHEPYDHTY